VLKFKPNKRAVQNRKPSALEIEGS